MNLSEELVNKAYSKANIDFHYLEPLFYNNTKARDGEINLDSIVKLSKRDNILKGQNDIINMFFVNAIDGHQGPTGRGMMNGNIVFIALGDENNTNAEKQKSMEAFVIAHEVGHIMGGHLARLNIAHDNYKKTQFISQLFGVAIGALTKDSAATGAIFSGGKQIKSLVPLLDVARCFKFMEEKTNTSTYMGLEYDQLGSFQGFNILFTGYEYEIFREEFGIFTYNIESIFIKMCGIQLRSAIFIAFHHLGDESVKRVDAYYLATAY